MDSTHAYPLSFLSEYFRADALELHTSVLRCERVAVSNLLE